MQAPGAARQGTRLAALAIAMSIESFRIDTPQALLDDLRQRLLHTRWPADLGDAGRRYGLSVPFMRELVAHWCTRFDWRRHEAALNRLPQFRARLHDGQHVHFVHERGHGPAPLPIVLTHGFPDSFARFTKLIPMLTDPA